MTVCSGGLMYAILQYGSHLKAPPDWSGLWQVLEPAIPAQTAKIHQSGIYLHVKVGDQPARPYRMEVRGDQYFLDQAGRQQQVKFERGPTGTTLEIPEADRPTLRLWRDANAPAAVQRDGTH